MFRSKLTTRSGSRRRIRANVQTEPLETRALLSGVTLGAVKRGILTLYAGDTANRREGVGGEEITNESFRITSTGTRRVEVEFMETGGQVVLGTQEFSGVKKIAFDGEDGDDRAVVESGVTASLVFYGGDGSDNLQAADTSGNSRLYGEDGSDSVVGGGGNDSLYGGGGSDLVLDQVGNNKMFGQNGSDLIHGGEGNDAINGVKGSDRLSGEEGKETIVGSSGKDTLEG
ncbi:MAG: calcium-binding protein, partial [Planctomycetaceae bacterium]